jgi:HSP20 family protein
MSLFFDPFRDLDRVPATAFEGRRGPRFVPMDLYRSGDHYVLNADIPGVDPGSVDIDVEGQVLTIRATRTISAPENSEWMAQERPSGSFVRQLSLGSGIDGGKISASYDNGVLSIVIPVSEGAKPRKIEITGGKSEPVAVTAGESHGTERPEDLTAD